MGSKGTREVCDPHPVLLALIDIRDRLRMQHFCVAPNTGTKANLKLIDVANKTQRDAGLPRNKCTEGTSVVGHKWKLSQGARTCCCWGPLRSASCLEGSGETLVIIIRV